MNLDAVKHLKVLIIGDAIYDRYCFVTTIGKSIKEPVISTTKVSEEEYRGGVWAGAAHLTDFCQHVDVFHGPVVYRNTRYLEDVYKRKIGLTVHEAVEEMDDTAPHIPDYDCVIVCDFGHGTMTPEMIKRVTAEAKFLCVNTQTNSQNYGFNLITKYPRADYVVVDELEARLATHDKTSPIEDVVLKLAGFHYKRMVVTLGANGAVGFDGTFHREPACADRITDTMGAGDAFLCVSSPFAAAGAPLPDLVKIGNIAGGLKAGILGHRSHVTKAEMARHL